MQNEADFQSGEPVGRVGFINPATRVVLWMRWVDGANPAYGRALGVAGRNDDLVGGSGQVGEAVGQAGAGSQASGWPVDQTVMRNMRSAFRCAIFARSSSESCADSRNATAGAVGWKG